ncbi:MAG TPA: sugar phosphate isomerase/epimerase family protein [Microvirga sp.]|jgi:sugar phosphate isomerase/epimerase|nr:sugar phosphate isomerase/epimerase family protein [Microvirga sp.]
MNRLALCNEVIRELPFARQCEVAAALGYHGLEVAPFTLGEEAYRMPEAERAAIRRAAADAGIAVSGLHWLLVAPAGLSITSADPAVRERTVEVMRHLVDLCADLGGGYLVHGSPAQRRLDPGDPAGSAERAVEAWTAAAQQAEGAGVVYCIEPLAPPDADFVNTLAEAAAVVRRIGSGSLRTMLDTSAAGLAEAEPVPDLVERWMPSGLIAHVQLNDRNRRGPGEGQDRFLPVLAALQAAGYTGWLAVEPFEYVPDGPTCAARSIGYVAGLLEALA